MDAATESYIVSSVGRLLDEEVNFENRKYQMERDELEKARRDTRAYWLKRLPPLLDPEPIMSITGAANLAGSIKDRINSAKARIASVSSNIDSGLGKLNEAADTGDKIAKQIEAEADDLLSQIGQFSNMPPE